MPRAQKAWELSLSGSKPMIGGPIRGLVAYYPFDGNLDPSIFVEEEKRANARASRRRAPAVVERTDPSLVPGVSGQAASFDGKSFVENTGDLLGFKAHGNGYIGYVDATDKSDHGASATVTYDDGHTFAAWIYPTDATGPIVTRDDNLLDEPNGYGLKLRGGKVQYDNVTKWNDESIQVETEQAISLNQWHHVAVTYSGSRWAEGVKIYIDGQEAKQKILFDDLNALAGLMKREPLRIGGGGGFATRFHGNIDEVRVYNRALSADEVGMLANRTPVEEIAAMPEAQRSPAQANTIREYFLEHAAPANIQQARAQVVRRGDSPGFVPQG